MVYPTSYTSVPAIVDAIWDPTLNAGAGDWSGGTPLDHALLDPWASGYNALEHAVGLPADVSSPSSSGNLYQRIAALSAAGWRITVSTTAPPTPAIGDGWLDTSGAVPTLKIYAGSSTWTVIGATASFLAGRAVDPAPPGDGQALLYDLASTSWKVATLPAPPSPPVDPLNDATPALHTLGTGAHQAASGADPRLSNARTPTAHGATHTGADPIPVFGPSGPSAAPGLVPSPGDPSPGPNNVRYLREDGAWSTPAGGGGGAMGIQSGATFTTAPGEPNLYFSAPVVVADTPGVRTVVTIPVFVPGASHAVGLVPDPGAGGGAARYLREDATWQTPPGSAYPPTFAGTTTPGLVPGPASGVTDVSHFLNATGTWTVPAGGGGAGTIQVEDEGGAPATVDTVNFVGPGIIATAVGTVATIGVPFFTASIPGVVPASPNNTTDYLRSDGAWAVPPGTGGSGDATSIQGVAVSATAPTTGQVLEYNGTLWLPATPSGGGGGSGLGLALDPYGNAVPPMLASSLLTAINPGTPGTDSWAVDATNGLYLGKAGNNGWITFWPVASGLSATDHTLTVCILANARCADSNILGIGWAATGANPAIISLGVDFGGTFQGLLGTKWNDSQGSHNGDYFQESIALNRFWLRLQQASGHRNLEWSIDGEHFLRPRGNAGYAGDIPTTDFMTTDRVGFLLMTASGGSRADMLVLSAAYTTP